MASPRWQIMVGDLLLFVLAGLLACVPFVPAISFWGFQHAAFLPGVLKFLPALGAALMMLIWLKPKSTEAIVTTLDLYCVNTHWYVHLIFAALIAAIGLLLPVPTHFLGDGYTVINSLSTPAPFVWSYSAPGVVLLLRAVQFLGGGMSSDTSMFALHSLSAVSAVLFVTSAFSVGKHAGATAAHRVLISFALLFTPLAIFWFGYAEHYPLVASALVWWGYCLIRFQALSWQTISMTAVVATLFTPFAPILLLPFIAAWLEKKRNRSVTSLLFNPNTFLIAVAAATVATLLIAVVSSMNLATRGYSLVSALSGSRDALFSLSYWSDRLNLLLLSFPLLIVLSFWHHKRSEKFSMHMPLAALICLVGFFSLNAVLGVAHDWDLLSLFLIPIFLLTLTEVDTAVLDSKRTLAAMIFAMALTLSFVAVQLNESAAVARHHSLLFNNHSKTGMGWRTLEKYYDANGDTARAGEIAREAMQYFPGDALRAQIRQEIAEEDFQEAFRLSQRLMIEERNADAYLLRGLSLSGQGLYRQAAADIDSALQMNRTLTEALLHRAELFLSDGRYDTSIVLLRQAATDSSMRYSALEALAYSWYQLRISDSMIATARLIREKNPNSPMVNLAFVENSLRLGDTTDAREYLALFEQHGRAFTEYEEVLNFYAPIVGLTRVSTADSSLHQSK
jgi:tetratricopeptide (TPR) repeat protein